MRVTLKDLESLVLHLNELTLNPTEYFTNDIINIGHYTLSGAYGGYELQQVMNKSGGVTTPLNTGHIPKKELYTLLHTFIKGIIKGEELLLKKQQQANTIREEMIAIFARAKKVYGDKSSLFNAALDGYGYFELEKQLHKIEGK